MAGFANFRQRVDAELDGAAAFWSFRKATALTWGAGVWFDLSMSPGNPVPNYYASAPMVSRPMSWSSDNGIRHAGSVAPAAQHLAQLTLMRAGTAGRYMRGCLLDYLMFYPFCDMAETSEQAMSNTAPLPRYADGAGVQIMPVIVAGQIGGGTIQVGYTNSDGVSGRYTTAAPVTTASAAVGTIATTSGSSAALFLPLQAGDVGVRSIESVIMTPADIGLITLVLVKPLCDWQLIDDAPTEINFLVDRPSSPVIADDAYLNLIACATGTAEVRTLNGSIKTVWH